MNVVVGVKVMTHFTFSGGLGARWKAACHHRIKWRGIGRLGTFYSVVDCLNVFTFVLFESIVIKQRPD